MSVEIYHLKPGPDGLTRITLRAVGTARQESWLEPTSSAVESVLDWWAAHHRRLLGCAPALLGPWTIELEGS